MQHLWGIISKFTTHAAGVVFCIPYTHMNDVRGADLAQPSTSAAPDGDKYELIAALTRVRGILFGEDFQQFLRGGATQRYSLTTYLDLFCYQPPEHRYNQLDEHQLVLLNCCAAPPLLPSVPSPPRAPTSSAWDSLCDRELHDCTQLWLS